MPYRSRPDRNLTTLAAREEREEAGRCVWCGEDVAGVEGDRARPCGHKISTAATRQLERVLGPRKPMRRGGAPSGGGGLVARLLQQLEDGRCARCDEPIVRAEQVGDVMFAVPCGHRIGLGDAAAYNRNAKRVG